MYRIGVKAFVEKARPFYIHISLYFNFVVLTCSSLYFHTNNPTSRQPYFYDCTSYIMSIHLMLIPNTSPHGVPQRSLANKSPRMARKGKRRYCRYSSERDNLTISGSPTCVHDASRSANETNSVHYEEFNKRLDGKSNSRAPYQLLYLTFRRMDPFIPARSQQRSRMACSREVRKEKGAHRTKQARRYTGCL